MFAYADLILKHGRLQIILVFLQLATDLPKLMMYHTCQKTIPSLGIRYFKFSIINQLELIICCYHNE